MGVCLRTPRILLLPRRGFETRAFITLAAALLLIPSTARLALEHRKGESPLRCSEEKEARASHTRAFSTRARAS